MPETGVVKSMDESDATVSAAVDDALATSQTLLSRAKSCDPQAWERLVRLYAPLVTFWCRESRLPEPDVNDLFQEVFANLARNIDRYRANQKGSFRGWLRTMTRNKVRDHFRKNEGQIRPTGGTEALHCLEQVPDRSDRNGIDRIAEDAPEAGTDIDENEGSRNQERMLQRKLLRDALENIRNGFSQQTWNAFWMVAIEGRETTDVAAQLSMKPGTVRVAKSRVLKRLRSELGDEE